jgi:predicted acylesterase/phospholipase RssA
MKRYILTIDGGGIRGLLPAMLLQQVEIRLNATLRKRFSMIAGTSTGGILACGLYAGVYTGKLVDLYDERGPAIFQRSLLRSFLTGFGLWAPRYSAASLERELLQVLGPRLLGTLSPTELLVPTYCVRLPTCEDTDGDGVVEGRATLFFKSWEARTDPALNFMLRDVARATSAAPVYFPAAEIRNLKGEPFLCVDGGTYANNPAMDAAADARRLWPDDELVVISLGTGSLIKAVPGSGNWGAAQWLPRISNVFIDGAADVVSYQMTHVAKLDPRVTFLRCETAITGASEQLDATGPADMAQLRLLAGRYVNAHLPRVLALF